MKISFKKTVEELFRIIVVLAIYIPVVLLNKLIEWLDKEEDDVSKR